MEGGLGGLQDEPECSADVPCAAPNTCSADGTCVPPPLLADGEACSEGDECRSGTCLLADGDSTCVTLCTHSENCSGGEICGLRSTGPASALTLTAACGPAPDPAGAYYGAACIVDEDCSTGICEGWTCTQLCGTCPNGAECVPRRVERESLSADLSVCENRLLAPTLSLGPFSVDETGSQDIQFTIPAGLVSFTVVLVDEEFSETIMPGFLRLSAPDGTVLLDFLSSEPDLNPPTAPNPGVTSVLVPSTDKVQARPQPGVYHLRVSLFETLDYVTHTPVAGVIEQVLVIFEPEDERGGVLDLNLFFSPGTAIDAVDAADDSFVQGALALMQRQLSAAIPMRLGRVLYGELPATYDVVADLPTVNTIATTYSMPGPHGASVNVFMVQDLTFTGGIAGGVPGPPGVFRTPASGIVLELIPNVTTTGKLLAHEVAHMLGLLHTTSAGGDTDAIDDTPECAGGTPIAECPDYTNLMFPFFPAAQALSLTTGQATVLAGTPWLYEMPADACAPGVPTTEISHIGVAAGYTDDGSSAIQSTCAASGTPERVHHFALMRDATSLTVRVTGTGFAPAVSLSTAGCDATATERACETGDAGVEVVVTHAPAPAADYFITVDARDSGSGGYVLDVAVDP